MQKLSTPCLIFCLLFLISLDAFSQSAFSPEKVLSQLPTLPANLEDNILKSDVVKREIAFNASSAFFSYFKPFTDQLQALQSTLQNKSRQNEASSTSEAKAIMKSKGVDVSKLDLDKLSEMSDEEAQKYLLNNVKKGEEDKKSSAAPNTSFSIATIQKRFIDPLNRLHAQYFDQFTNNNSDLFAPYEKEKSGLADEEYKELQSVPKINKGEYQDMPDPVKTKAIKTKYEALQKEVTQKEFTRAKEYFYEYKGKLMTLSIDYSHFIQANQNKSDLFSVNALMEVQQAFINTFQDDLLVAAQNVCFHGLTKRK